MRPPIQNDIKKDIRDFMAQQGIKMVDLVGLVEDSKGNSVSKQQITNLFSPNRNIKDFFTHYLPQLSRAINTILEARCCSIRLHLDLRFSMETVLV